MKNNAVFLAQVCEYAQTHVGCPDAWGHVNGVLPAGVASMMEPTSFVVACFLAQNTVEGPEEGVEWDVVFEELCHMPPFSKEEWLTILNAKALLYGGWKDKEVNDA